MSLTLTLILAMIGGIGIPVGALISTNRWLRSFCSQQEIDSFVSYFGGGALLAAIALVLIPHGIEHVSILAAAVTFLVGGIIAWCISAWIHRSGTSASLLVGMMSDFVPEAIALGAASASGSKVGYLLAGLIALQNMPEGFASFHEMSQSGTPRSRLWGIFLIAPLAGPISAWVGYTWLSENDHVLGLVMLLCSGGILYLIFEDIAPGAHLKRHDFPAIGAVLGFLLGMVGTMLIH